MSNPKLLVIDVSVLRKDFYKGLYTLLTILYKCHKILIDNYDAANAYNGEYRFLYRENCFLR